MGSVGWGAGQPYRGPANTHGGLEHNPYENRSLPVFYLKTYIRDGKLVKKKITAKTEVTGLL